MARAAVRTRTKRSVAPKLRVEQGCFESGDQLVCGIDEVGRGAWAGPLMVGAAILPESKRVNGVRDSKLLTETERERLFDRIAGWCTAWAVGAASQEECDELGMAAAQRLAAQRAIESLGVVPDAAVVDGKWDFVSPHVAHVVRRVKADQHCLSVAAASILAKVTRDREMRELAEHLPHWNFEFNKGYPCAVHRAALIGYGPSTQHRRTWVFMDHYVPWTGITRVYRPDQPTLF
jgi:ribonuclease HII